MTNVPQPVRDAWADIYKLFDVSYNMDGSDDAWIQYWERANALIKKHGDEIPLLQMCEAIAGMLETFCNQRKTGNKSLSWNKDEDYPYPKE